MDYLAIARKAKTEFRKAQGANPQAPEHGDTTEGRFIAVLIDSPIIGPVWFAFDDDFKSGDDIPVFFASELAHFAKMSGKELRKEYERKLALRGGWVRDRVEGPIRH